MDIITLLLAGSIYWYDPQKGIGYIKWSRGVVFFHYSVVIGKKKGLKRGDQVRFDVNKDKPTVASKVINK